MDDESGCFAIVLAISHKAVNLFNSRHLCIHRYIEYGRNYQETKSKISVMGNNMGNKGIVVLCIYEAEFLN